MKRGVFLIVVVGMFGMSCAQAGEVYAGVGFPGLFELGYAQALSSQFGLRADVGAGLSMDRNGLRDGMNYQGKVTASRLGLFADCFPMRGAFRLTAGLTINDIKAKLNSQGGSATINGKPVDLSNEFFNVDVKYPDATPYLGIGWGHQASDKKGLGFFADLGVQIGKFKSTVQTNVVGTQGITQADVDAQANSVRDSLAKLTVLPVVAAGVSYGF